MMPSHEMNRTVRGLPTCDPATTQRLSRSRCRKRQVNRFGLVGVVISLLFAGGCASTANLVKENLRENTSLLGNAISSALTFGKECKPAPAKAVKGYPCVPVEENAPRVRQFIRDYAYRQRETMRKYLGRADHYLPMVKAVTKEHGLPADLAYLCLLESGANPEARSPANALGMWQFMPDTARSYGLRVDSWVDERLDPQKSTKAAMLYLKDLYGMFGCWRLALSAYNSGENKLNKVLCQEAADEYDEICSSKRLKRETREFYPRFQAIAYIANNAEKFGFSPVKDASQKSEHEFVPVEGSYSLAALAEAMDVPHGQLEEMNPALLRGTTPPADAPYALKVPLGKKRTLAAKLNDMSPVPAQPQVVHVVHKGDSVGRICHRYGVDKHRLAELNPDVNLRKRLRAGSKIVVPVTRVKAKSKTANKGQRLSWSR
jgi:membrane-bound lytic murein transglycosylase D